ncbi:MAG: carboxypeptidase regulatory-like domain-containing protein [Chitinispirillaceae bacterium]|nr:carboxypeptidase regulatory-like domain-containing protein [Chitinispirillaceae bacterium]
MRKYRLSTFALILGVCVFFSLRCDRTILPVVDSSEQVIDSNEKIESNETTDNLQKIDYLQGNTVARVIIKVFDNHSAAPISGAWVTMVGVDSAKSDSTGTVVFDSVKTGNYMLSCTRNGFESIMDNVRLAVDSNSNTVPVVSQSTSALFMARRGAAVKGNLYYKNENRIYPADGATVECRSTNASIAFQRPLVTTTSDDGKYSFSDLPEYSTYTIIVLPFHEGSLTYKQAARVSLDGRAVGDTLSAGDIILEKDVGGTFIVLNHNLEAFTKDDSLEFEFSEAVDTDLLGVDSIYVTLSPGGTRILAELIWKENDEKLFIIPFDGAWDASQDYTLAIGTIKSVTGKPLDNTDFASYDFAPSTIGTLDDVEDVRFRVGDSDINKVDYNTGSISLRWSPLENTIAYQIYQKSSSDSLWLFFNSTADTIISVSTTEQFNLGKQIQFIVLGQNSGSVSSFENATIVTVRDQTPPSLSGSFTQAGFDNSGSDSFDTIDIPISSRYLPEPMDTTDKPTASVIEAGYVTGRRLYGDTLYTVDPDNCFWTWTSDTTGIMSVVIDSLQNGAYDSLKIDFTSVTDWAGNKPDTTIGDDAGYITIQTLP